jgi:hypothetical protein
MSASRIITILVVLLLGYILGKKFPGVIPLPI